LLDIIEGLPSLFGKGTLEKTVLRGFGGLLRANLASGEDCHNPNLGLGTKAKVCKGVRQEECERV
jgi:hypothetical protein